MNLTTIQGCTRSFILPLIYSNLVTAISVSTLTFLTFSLLNYLIVLPVLLLVFSGTLLIYTLNRFTDVHEDSINLPERVTFIRNYGKVIFLIAIILYTISLVMVSLNSTIAGIVAMIPLIIAVSYSCFRLKKIFLIKNILISTGGICSVLIVGAYYNDFSTFLAFLTAIFFISIFVNTIIFDVKDLRGDKLFNIQTFPVKYGFKKTKYCCYFLLIPLFLITFNLMTSDIRFSILLPFLGYITSYIFFLKDPEQYPEWYFGFYVDGEYIFLLLFIVIFSLTGIFHVHLQ